MGGCPHLEIGLLDDVLRVVGVPQNGEGQGIDGLLRGAVQDLEGLRIPLADQGQQALLQPALRPLGTGQLLHGHQQEHVGGTSARPCDIMTAKQSLYHRAGREGKSFPSYG